MRQNYLVRTYTTDGYAIERVYSARSPYEAVSMGRRTAIAAFPGKTFSCTVIVSVDGRNVMRGE